ncbi:MAG: hypothetical protein SF028_03855 [Candidatus Sumerlaeia bacterium]|nr:hypothetical protein [Candidatus Sumerlaeia bacterium]
MAAPNPSHKYITLQIQTFYHSLRVLAERGSASDPAGDEIVSLYNQLRNKVLERMGADRDLVVVPELSPKATVVTAFAMAHQLYVLLEKHTNEMSA